MMNVNFMYSIMTLKYGEYLKLTAVSRGKKRTKYTRVQTQLIKSISLSLSFTDRKPENRRPQQNCGENHKGRI